MNRNAVRNLLTAAIACAGMLAVGSSYADRPSWAGNGNADKHQERDRHEDRGDKHRERDERGEHEREHEHEKHGRNEETRYRFSSRDRDELHSYYRERFRSGHCPPGLARKHNGCMPPGQAKKWEVGKRLPRDVTFYNLPHAVTARLTPPPAGYRYVRVASDILLIAAGTGMVMDAISDLGK